MLFGYQPHISDDEILAPPAENVRSALLDIYHDRVDCLFKATYWPAAETAIIRRYEECKKGSSCVVRAVERAIYFMAVCTMTESECETMLSDSRSNLIYRHRRAVEIALARSEFLTNPDKLALQAFVLYLVCYTFQSRTKQLEHSANPLKDGTKGLPAVCHVLDTTGVSYQGWKCSRSSPNRTVRFSVSW
jgi:hypothetical protein